jgi:hypothetical protein
VFADVYGCLGAGPAFVSTLMDLLAADALAGPAGLSGDYPPAGLRIAVNLCALERLGHGATAEQLRARWVADIDGAHGDPAEQPFTGDIPAVVDRLLYGPYPELGCRALVDVLRFTDSDQRQSLAAALRSRDEALGAELLRLVRERRREAPA